MAHFLLGIQVSDMPKICSFCGWLEPLLQAGIADSHVNVNALTRDASAGIQVAEPVNACSFAAGLSGAESGINLAVNPFHGQTGCLYLFNDVLNPGAAADSNCLSDGIAALSAECTPCSAIHAAQDNALSCSMLLQCAPAQRHAGLSSS